MSTSMTVLAPLSKPEAALFWAAPAPADSEFSPEDPLALDYLGQQMGLRLLPRLTTRTSRAQYYAVVLYGLHLAELAIAEYGLPAMTRRESGCSSAGRNSGRSV
jgi:hypothetical protein